MTSAVIRRSEICCWVLMAEGHIQISRGVPVLVNMAFGQTIRNGSNSWGDAPGYGENGLRP